jgi:hypothetical protein
MRPRKRRYVEPLLVRKEDIGAVIPVGESDIDAICKSGKLDVRQLGPNKVAVTYESLKALAASYPPALNYPLYQGLK